MTNTNCLEGLRCPKCKNEVSLLISGVCLFEVYDDGAEPCGHTEWGERSLCICPRCNHQSTLLYFNISQQDQETPPPTSVEKENCSS